VLQRFHDGALLDYFEPGRVPRHHDTTRHAATVPGRWIDEALRTHNRIRFTDNANGDAFSASIQVHVLCSI